MLPPQTDCEELLFPSNGIKLSTNLALKILLGEAKDKDKDKDNGKDERQRQTDCKELLFPSNGIKLSTNFSSKRLLGEDKGKYKGKTKTKTMIATKTHRLRRAFVPP